MSIKIIKELGYAVHAYPRDSIQEKLPVRQVYLFNNESVKSKANAEAWAKGTWRGEGPSPVAAKSRPNTPMTNLWLDTLEYRGEGGRAYKVINKDDMTYFDLREDQLLQGILKHGISAGGKLNGEWVFAMDHSQCKCVLTDSEEYAEALEKDARPVEQKTKVSLKDLKVGHIYTDKNVNCEYIYVGFLPNKVCVKAQVHGPYDHNLRKWTVLSPAVYELKNKHTFIIKQHFFNNYDDPIPGFLFKNPSTLYPTGKSLTIAEIKQILKGQNGYSGSENAELKERVEAHLVDLGDKQ